MPKTRWNLSRQGELPCDQKRCLHIAAQNLALCLQWMQNAELYAEHYISSVPNQKFFHKFLWFQVKRLNMVKLCFVCFRLIYSDLYYYTYIYIYHISKYTYSEYFRIQCVNFHDFVEFVDVSVAHLVQLEILAVQLPGAAAEAPQTGGKMVIYTSLARCLHNLHVPTWSNNSIVIIVRIICVPL